MSNKEVRFASQTYSWQMSNQWHGRLDEIVHVVSAAGFPGIEPEVCMTGRFEEASALKRLLETSQVELAALTLVLDWQNAEETENERLEANRIIDILKTFPKARLVLVQMPANRENERVQAQENLLRCLGDVTRRASDAGLTVTFHPNSPNDSIVRTREDYDRVLPRLPAGLGWTPDTGHLAAGGMEVIQTIRDYLPIVNHLHLKDADSSGSWVRNGQGTVDMTGAVAVLAQAGYDGWIVLEDESPRAEADPHGTAFANAEYFRSRLAPLFSDKKTHFESHSPAPLESKERN